MNNLVRDQLCNLVTAYGDDTHVNTERLKFQLGQLCPGCDEEIGLVTYAAKRKVPDDLLAGRGASVNTAQMIELMNRLQDKLPIPDEKALWTVETWALAYGRLDRANLGDGSGDSDITVFAVQAADLGKWDPIDAAKAEPTMTPAERAKAKSEREEAKPPPAKPAASSKPPLAPVGTGGFMAKITGLFGKK